MKTRILAALAVAVLIGCGQGLPQHEVETSSLAPRQGKAVRIAVQDPAMTRDQCRKLLNRYAAQARPDGMVAVSKPSPVLRGTPGVFCREDAQAPGVHFDDKLFPAGNAQALQAAAPAAPVQPNPRAPTAQQSAMAEIHDQVITDALEQYRITTQHGSQIDRCVHAQLVGAAILQAKKEQLYADWKVRERQECAAAGLPQ